MIDTGLAWIYNNLILQASLSGESGEKSMKEIVDRILQEEELARKKIVKAESEGKSMVLQAAEESRKIIKDAVVQADLSSQAKKDQAYKAFMAEKEKSLSQIRDQISGKIEARSKDIPAIAGRLFARVIEGSK